ncbi:MAG: hypothetical protein A2V88_08290 [Elusimicrobia bacterium RBG_16_66_12]|nr:MAG: hypothetical protein A2V88_08290 [Elusimicrobia bacterium RBG_16_66_12]
MISMKLGTTTHKLTRDPIDPRVFVVVSRCEICRVAFEARAPGALPARLVAEHFDREHEHGGTS